MSENRVRKRKMMKSLVDFSVNFEEILGDKMVVS